MHRTLRSGALAAIVFVLALGACSGGSDDSEADIKARVADQLSADGGLDEEAAECFAGVIVDEIGTEDLKDVDFSAEEPPAELQEAFTTAAIAAIDTCDIDPESLGN
jgi:hypothetical protein